MMSLRTPVVASLCLAVALLAGCKGSQDSVKSETPEAVFATAKAAMQQKDYKQFVQCLTPQSQDMMAGGMVMAGVMMKAFGGMAAAMGGDDPEAAKAKEGLKEIDAVLKKHGIDEETMQKNDSAEHATMEEAMAAVIGPIKDKPGFIVDMMTALEKLGDKDAKQPAEEMLGELADVKIDGDKATGVVVTTSDGEEKREPIEFVKGDSGWRIHLPMNVDESSSSTDMPPMSPPDFRPPGQGVGGMPE